MQLQKLANAVYRLTYFNLWAKGPAPALALSHSGLKHELVYPKDWSKEKGKATFSKLPMLQVEGGPTISHELAILNFIGRVVPKMAGENTHDYLVSQQLMCESEDIYAKLTRFQPTTSKKEKVTKEELDAFWSKPPNMMVHNREQGLHGNLRLLDDFYETTSSGTSIGECKLYSTLHLLRMIDGSVLETYGFLTISTKRHLRGHLLGSASFIPLCICFE